MRADRLLSARSYSWWMTGNAASVVERPTAEGLHSTRSGGSPAAPAGTAASDPLRTFEPTHQDCLSFSRRPANAPGGIRAAGARHRSDMAALCVALVRLRRTTALWALGETLHRRLPASCRTTGTSVKVPGICLCVSIYDYLIQAISAGEHPA